MMSDQDPADSFELVQNYFRDHFKKPPRGIFARLVGEARDYNYRIVEKEKYLQQQYFNSSQLIWVAVADSYLDQVRLPAPRSWGLFALHNNECLHLCSRNPENFSKVLAREKSIASIPAEAIATLFCDAVLTSKNMCYKLVCDLKSIQNITTAPLDQREFSKLSSCFQQVSRLQHDDRITVEFTAIGVGFNVSRAQLITLKIDSSLSFSYTAKFLSSNLFLMSLAYKR